MKLDECDYHMLMKITGFHRKCGYLYMYEVMYNTPAGQDR